MDAIKEATNGLPTPEQMRQALNDERAKREQLCLNAVQQILTEYRCQIEAAPAIAQDGRLTAVARIVTIE